MQINLRQTEKLLSTSQAFSQLGFSMLLTRLKTQYAKDPSPATLAGFTAEINAFLAKFSSIMEQDYAIITKL